jgi:16S rRNA (adenine1518-N6/adenine1519-N6)-dimethyltransferase
MKRSRRHALGQHFLSQPGVLGKIVRVIDPRPDEVVLEVGPGKGGLTALLAARAGRVIGVEKDERLIPGLRALRLDRTQIVEADILTADWAGLLERFGRGFARAKLAGNIPYAISSPLLDRVLERRGLFVLCVFLVQKEFSEKLAAGPGSKSYGPLSIISQRFFEVRRRFAVAPGSFTPPPRVESEVVSLVPLPAVERPVADEAGLARFLHACFAERRKTLANNLVRLGSTRPAAEAALAAAGLDPKARAEDVPGAAFVDLFERLGPTAGHGQAR